MNSRLRAWSAFALACLVLQRPSIAQTHDHSAMAATDGEFNPYVVSFKSSVVNHDGWELNACPIDGATMTVDANNRIRVVWFTQTGDTPRLYLASSTDYGTSFTKPVVFDPAQKLARHAHIVAVSGNRLLIAWDDVNPSSAVKWGLFDISARSLKILGTRQQASYPIVAMSGDAVSVVALQSNHSTHKLSLGDVEFG